MAARRIAVSCGDPSGLGPELIERCLGERSYEDVEFFVFGPGPWLDRLKVGSRNSVSVFPLCDVSFDAGRPTSAGARVAVEAMEAVAQACLDGSCDAVVTGPISKELCAGVGYAFPGQTEFFAARWGGEPTMAFVGDRLKLCLATWHVPLAEVPATLTRQVFSRSVRAAAGLASRLGIAAPRVIVCGLNPHAGEGGLLGSEERDLLNPWLETLRGEFDSKIEGCVPGDTAFARAMRGEADVVVAMYHDQGLAPFKAVDFESGVNVTLGLPYVRTSPDHGTGFEIAGKGSAHSESMDRAIRLAVQLG